MTLSQCLAEKKDQLIAADIPSAALDSDLIATHVLQKDKTWLITHAGYILSDSELASIDDMVTQRAKRVPLAYLTGHKEFYGREFVITPDVLIPRPETEELIEIIKELAVSQSLTPNSQLRILDVGCGSGCIGLSTKLELPDAKLTLSDVEEAALDVAKQNSQSLGVEDVTYLKSDLLEHWLHQDSPEQYDLIVSNLPYVDPTWETSPELDHEPAEALYADDNGLLLIKKLIDQASQLLVSRGYLLLEADPRQFDAIVEYSDQFSEVKRQNFALLLRLTA